MEGDEMNKPPTQQWIKNNYLPKVAAGKAASVTEWQISESARESHAHRASELNQVKSDKVTSVHAGSQNPWKRAARIQPVNLTRTDGIIDFMEKCTNRIEELHDDLDDRAPETPIKGLPLHEKHLHSASPEDGSERAEKTGGARLAPLKVNALESRAGHPDAAATATRQKCDLATEEYLPNECYDDQSLTFLLHDFRLIHEREYFFTGNNQIVLERLQHLTALTISDHWWLSPEVIKQILSFSRNLAVLELSGCRVDHAVAQALRGCTRLNALDLSYTKTLRSLASLQYLEVSTS
ncbi:hypothetical protein TGVAND_225955 [Toxoplasma gondii VAND]|uniref:Uncharacterized protein n=1 Tax=Toxoplasma gondii VAND TaxID=933077 RepID=A0A086QKV3_TOXGO|nr:hypothetical protein TGVAND_225955 [Toxoplasma gondii VAND]